MELVSDSHLFGSLSPLQMLRHRGSSALWTLWRRRMSGVGLPSSAGTSRTPPTTPTRRLSLFVFRKMHIPQDKLNSSLIFSPSSHIASCLFRLQVAVQVKPVYAPPQLLPIGKETITYIATDRTGNQANCSFAVTVVGELILSETICCIWYRGRLWMHSPTGLFIAFYISSRMLLITGTNVNSQCCEDNTLKYLNPINGCTRIKVLRRTPDLARIRPFIQIRSKWSGLLLLGSLKISSVVFA